MQVGAVMADDHGHLRAMRLLPFAAAGGILAPGRSACRDGSSGTIETVNVTRETSRRPGQPRSDRDVAFLKRFDACQVDLAWRHLQCHRGA